MQFSLYTNCNSKYFCSVLNNLLQKNFHHNSIQKTSTRTLFSLSHVHTHKYTDTVIHTHILTHIYTNTETNTCTHTIVPLCKDILLLFLHFYISRCCCCCCCVVKKSLLEQNYSHKKIERSNFQAFYWVIIFDIYLQNWFFYDTRWIQRFFLHSAFCFKDIFYFHSV